MHIYLALDSPSSMVLDPEKGKMFWADDGESPKIEMSWMDGSRRMPLVTTRLHHPTGLTVDTAMDHALYWVDTKLNVIESIKYDQKNRVVVIRGGELRRIVVAQQIWYWYSVYYNIIFQNTYITPCRWTYSKTNCTGGPGKPES